MSGVPSRSRSRRLLQRGDLHRQARERRRDLESAHVATSVPDIGEFTPAGASRQAPIEAENDLQATPTSHFIPSGQSSGSKHQSHQDYMEKADKARQERLSSSQPSK